MRSSSLKKYPREHVPTVAMLSHALLSYLFAHLANIVHKTYDTFRAASSTALRPSSSVTKQPVAQKPRASIASVQSTRKSVGTTPSATTSHQVAAKKPAVTSVASRASPKTTSSTSGRRSTITPTLPDSSKKGTVPRRTSLASAQTIKKASTTTTKNANKEKETNAELQEKNKELLTKIESLSKELNEKTKIISELEKKNTEIETLKTKCNEFQLETVKYTKERDELINKINELNKDKELQKENFDLISTTSTMQQQELESTRLQYDAQQKLVESLNDKIQQTEVVLTTKLELLTEELKEKDTHEVELERTVSDQEELIIQQNTKIALLEKKLQEEEQKKKNEIQEIEKIYTAKINLLEEKIKINTEEYDDLQKVNKKLQVDLKEETKEKYDKLAKKIGAINILFQQFEKKYSKELENPPPAATIVITDEKSKSGVDMLKQVLELQAVLEDARARAALIQEEKKANETEKKWLRDMIDSLLFQLEAYQKQDGSINKFLTNENKELKERLFYANVLTVKLSDPKLLAQNTYSTEDLFALALERNVPPQNYMTFITSFIAGK